jgi:hypothetical protein
MLAESGDVDMPHAQVLPLDCEVDYVLQTRHIRSTERSDETIEGPDGMEVTQKWE